MKKVTIGLGILGILLIGGYLFIRFSLRKDVTDSKARWDQPADSAEAKVDLRPLFISKIQQIVKDGSNGVYDLTIDSMDVDLLNSFVVLHNISMVPNRETLKGNPDAPEDLFTVSFRKMRIEGINLDDVITRRTIDFKRVIINDPVIEAEHLGKKTVDTITLFDRIKKHVDRIAIADLVIEGADFISKTPARKSKSFRIDDVMVRLTDILIDSATGSSNPNFLFAKEGRLSVKNLLLKTDDNLYSFRLGYLEVSANQKTALLQNLSFTSDYNRQQFQKKVAHQTELYDCVIPEIKIYNIDWWRVFQQNTFIAEKAESRDGRLKIFLDRSLPRPASKMGNFPHQVIMKLPFKLYVEKMNLRNLAFTYEEYNPLSKQSGAAHMDNVNLDVKHLTNIPLYVRKYKNTEVKGTGLFMKEIPVRATYAFDLENVKKGKFSSTFVAEGFHGPILNKLAAPLGLMTIESGDVKNFTVKMEGDEQRASGRVLVLYNDFKVALYEKESDEKGLDKKGLIGLLANTFVIKDDNPKKNKPPRHADVTFDRDPQAGFFNLVWKTALSGVLKTVGAGTRMAKRKK